MPINHGRMKISIIVGKWFSFFSFKNSLYKYWLYIP